ncbi:MAG: hypothetical protein CMI24_08190 [Opitutae bacterium]|nr:hypothetical protein [Opitutae bacterium]
MFQNECFKIFFQFLLKCSSSLPIILNVGDKEVADKGLKSLLQSQIPKASRKTPSHSQGGQK